MAAGRPQPSEPSDPSAPRPGGPAAELAFRGPLEWKDAYAREVAFGAVFLPDRVELRAGQQVLVRFSFPFLHRQVDLEGEVVVVVPAAMAKSGAAPGAAVQLRPRGDELRRHLEAATGLVLPPVDVLRPHAERREVRLPARTEALLEVAKRCFTSETLDISYNGMLLSLPGLDLSVGTELVATLVHPRTDESIRVEGRVMNRTPCDHGVMVVGVQFLYAMDRVDEVMAFVDDLQAFHHARELAAVTGSVAETPLETVLETFSGIASQGTLELRRGDDEGRIAYADGQILYAITGLVSGTKALGRMFTWMDARFEFQPRVRPIDSAEEPVPLESALFSAAVQRDDFALLEVRHLPADTCFELDAARHAAAKADLDALESEIAENAGLGFPLGALLDILPASDVAIYKGLSKLLDEGLLSFAEE